MRPFAAALVLLGAACSAPPAPRSTGAAAAPAPEAEPAPEPAAPLAVLRQWSRAAAARDADAMIELYAADAVVIPASSGIEIVGAGPIAYQFFAPFWNAFPDLESEPVVALSRGDVIISLGRSRGTHRGEMLGFPPTGERTSFYGLSVMVVKDGAIVRQTAYADNLSFMGQLGLYRGRHRPYDASPAPELRTAVAGSSAAEADNAALARAHLEAIGQHRVGAATAQLAADALLAHQALPIDLRGRDAIGLELRRFLAAFSDLAIEIEGVWAAGDWVAVTYVVRGTHNGPLGEIRPSGETIELEAADLYRVEDGAIAERWVFLDGMALMAQINALSLGR